MGKNNATVLQDGQLAVATVPQTGTIISDASAVDATALVQTDNGPQLCVKTVDINGGGGGGGTVDQTYDPTSTNAQSGTAVAEAVQPYLKNTATGSNYSLTILGDANSQSNSVNIGWDSRAANGTVSIGTGAMCSANYCVSIGMGANTRYSQRSLAIGSTAEVTSNDGIAIGRATKVSATNAIQLGANGSLLTENNQAKTLQVYEYQLLDGNTGKIPMARLPIVQCTQAEYDALVSGGTVDANTIYCIIPA